MSKDSAIGWTDHTFNPWWGCFKVSPGCQSCYAEAFSKRTGHDVWGPPKTTSRRLFGEAHWREPLKWDVEAGRDGVRRRVFCASMADVFEEHPDVWNERNRLWDLIAETRNLDWLLLTKRPENVMGMVPMDWAHDWPEWVWIGTSVENQEAADERIPQLLRVPAAVRFLSCEPLLGPVDLTAVNYTAYLRETMRQAVGEDGAASVTGPALLDVVYGEWFDGWDSGSDGKRVDWVIVGGESGPRHRSMAVSWLSDIVEPCVAAHVPVFTKQDSGMYPGRQGRIPDDLWLHQLPAVRGASGAAS